MSIGTGLTRRTHFLVDAREVYFRWSEPVLCGRLRLSLAALTLVWRRFAREATNAQVRGPEFGVG